MTSKELMHLNRSELLQLLLTQVEENDRLRSELTCCREQLNDRTIRCENAGSIAEAALQVNGVFEAAQQAAQQYLDNIMDLEKNQQARHRKLEEDARQYAAILMEEADAYKESTMRQADEYKARTLREADEYWQSVRDRVSQLMQSSQPASSVTKGSRRK